MKIMKINPEASINVKIILVKVLVLMPIKFIILRMITSAIAIGIIKRLEGIPIKDAR